MNITILNIEKADSFSHKIKFIAYKGIEHKLYIEFEGTIFLDIENIDKDYLKAKIRQLIKQNL